MNEKDKAIAEVLAELRHMYWHGTLVLHDLGLVSRCIEKLEKVSSGEPPVNGVAGKFTAAVVG